MSKTLTKEMRENIIDDCVNATFKKRDEAIKKALQKFAIDLHAHEFGKEAKIVAKLPPIWHNLSSQIRVISSLVKTNRSMHICGELGMDFEFGNKLIMPEGRQEGYYDVKVAEGHALFDRLSSLQVEYASIYSDKETLKRNLVGLLASCRTLKQLRETWPEGKKFIPDEPVPVGSAVVPFEVKSTVNRMMGLI